MSTDMMALTKAYIGAIRQRQDIHDTMVRLLQQVDAKYADYDFERDEALRNVQRDLYVIILSDKLAQDQRYEDLTLNQLIGEAELILSKRPNSERLVRPGPETRSIEEERMYGALRVRWHELLKEAGVRAASRSR